MSAGRDEANLRKITILVIGSASLSRIIGHLLRGQPEFEIVRTVSGLTGLGRHASLLLPELIVANVKPVSIRICRAVTSIKQSSPSSKLILVCPVEDLAGVARKCGADAFLKDEKLGGHLLRTARTLTERPRLADASD
jgi:hypothetical protein